LQIGRLPVALTHASAAVVDGRILIIGGRRQLTGEQTSSILAVDPNSGATRRVGRLPLPLSDASTATIGKAVIVAGGESTDGTQRAVLTLTPHLR
jgi:N-acetylneuraminic acid mutarotase